MLNHGLPAALEALADRSPVPTLVECESREPLPETVELAAYFVASEALANVAKYSKAERASVRLTRTDGVAVIQIADDGIGGADERDGSGLRGLGDRVEALSGGSTSPARPAPGRSSPRSCPSSSVRRMTAERDLDVVVYGATGFVGRLTAALPGRARARGRADRPRRAHRGQARAAARGARRRAPRTGR